jgi:hypothetical protein
MTPLPQKNTVVILDSCGEDPLQFFDFQEDLSHWNGALINSTETPEDLQNEISAKLYPVGEPAETFPVTQLVNHIDGWNTEVVVVVFLP